MYKAVLFDLDGTLTDTLQDIAAAMNRALRLHGLMEFAVEDYRYLVGDGAKKLAERAVRGRLELKGAVLRDYQAYYETHNLVTTRPYDGVPELLSAILPLFPLDEYAAPVYLMDKAECDRALQIPIWDEYRRILARYTDAEPVMLERYEFYERAKKAYAVVVTGESAIYANVILKKGVVK